jgi:hypothetical protein
VNSNKAPAESWWALSVDLLSAKVLVWVASVGRDADLTPEAHYHAGGGDGPPYAAAMAMPRPTRFVRTEAVSRSRFSGPDDAA